MTLINWSVCSCTPTVQGSSWRLSSTLVLIAVHGAFLNNSLSVTIRSGLARSNVVWIARWSDPCSVGCMEHVTISSATSAVASTRSIVLSLSGPCHVFVPLGRRLQRPCSFMRSMIGSASPCLAKATSSPPHSRSCWLKSPASMTSTAIPALLLRSRIT
ncbi:hypothetical protein EDB80DRAFT_733405, partial [Ilyonectria destructans]